MSTFLASSRALAGLPRLASLLDAEVRLALPWQAPKADAVLAWGLKPSSLRAARLATRLGLPLLRLEDGFLRSLGTAADSPPLSMVLDDLGIYYDARHPSHLEKLISSEHSAPQLQRAAALISAWREARVSKFNHAPESAALARTLQPYVMVADQTLGDASISHGAAGPASFHTMLEAALAENPGCRVLLKVHPDVVAKRKQAHFDLDRLKKNERVQIIGEDWHPAGLIEYAEAVYAVTSQIGFEALLWGKRTRTFGMPFYAGWGLTQDKLAMPERRAPVELEDLVHAALIDYPRYLDPETGERCEVERVLEWMGLQRTMRVRFPAQVHALGFSLYKKPMVRCFFQGSTVRFAERQSTVPEKATLAVWGKTEVKKTDAVKVVRLEDGFLRSVGLGADLTRPLSWVMDQEGIYYDSSFPSDLERILQNHRFAPLLLERAKKLSTRLVDEGLTKYNVGASSWRRPVSSGRRVILVPGQVETDAALAYATPGIRRNIELLRAVRMAHPHDYLLYKPHPDVIAGLRRAGMQEQHAVRWCDEMVEDVAMGELLRDVDEVHTLTSLCGFEALLRGKRVVCYGQPFYAGWGLTVDMAPIPRRTRRLSIAELAAGALILYPTYISRATGCFTTPERVLDELLAWRTKAGSGFWEMARRPLLRLVSRLREK